MVDAIEISSEESADEELKESPALQTVEVEELPAVIEALIFASTEPLSLPMIKEVFERQGFEFSDAVIRKALHKIEQDWSSSFKGVGQGLELAHVAGGYVFRTHPKYGFVVRTLLQEKPQKLTTSQLEVLAIISYRQPVTRTEIEEIRGVDSSSAMRRLLGIKLIKILGKSQGIGRPLLYGTTKQFLEFFGLNSLHDLPTLKEYQELSKDSAIQDAADRVEEQGSLALNDLFMSHEKREMFSQDTEKLSQEALESLEEALGVVANASQKVDIDQVLQSPGGSRRGE